MPLHQILILGAGPAGLATALALAQLSRSQPSSPVRITVLEIRPKPTNLGGTINLTPLALRYLDRLGAGTKLRSRGMPVRGIDLVSLRTGSSLGTLWKDVDALRARRSDLVASLLETCREKENVELIDIQFGVKVVSISEVGTAEGEGKVVLRTDGGETIEGDVLIGCDGIHSAARRLYVEPERKPEYSGKAVAYGPVELKEPGKVGIYMGDGSQAVTDTSLFSGQYGSMMATFAEPEKKELHFGGVLGMADVPEGDREGWKTRGQDKSAVRSDIMDRFKMWKIRGLLETLEKVEDWTLFPVYKLPPRGRWSRGRVMIIGDAAHAMPPQGESTGVSIEDGVLVAHVCQRHGTRTVAQLFADYEMLRRQDIEKLYKETAWRWQNAATPDAGWLWGILMEWMAIGFVWLMKWKQADYFASDVAKLKLPK